MTSLGFENYAEALKIYLSKYREVRPEILATPCLLTRAKTQSARGENQQQQSANRPTSSGGSASGYVGGPVGGSNAGGSGTAPSGPNAPNNILSPHAIDPDQDANQAYGYGIVPTGNGAGGDGY